MDKVNILETVNITNNRVKPFEGTKRYLATGDLSGDQIDEGIIAVDYENKPSRADLLVHKGNIIVARMQSTNKVLLIDESTDDLIVSTGFLTLSPKKDFDNKYLSHYFRSPIFQRAKDRFCSGATQKAINNGSFGKLQVSKYSLHEQEKIANEIDCAESLRQKCKEQLVLLDDYLKSVFLDMFGDPIVNLKKWRDENMGDMLQFLTSGSRGWARYYSSNGSKFLRIQNVGLGQIKLSDLAYVTAPDGAEARRTKVQPEDVLLSITADLGRACVVPNNIGDAYINQHLSILRLKKILNPYFLTYYLTSDGGRCKFLQKDKGGVKAGLNFDDIKTYRVHVPPIDLQNRFALIVEQVEQTKQKMRASLDEMDNYFNALRQRYFG